MMLAAAAMMAMMMCMCSMRMRFGAHFHGRFSSALKDAAV